MKENGITLIALVVTVVVLLILATISINLAFGDSGVFSSAKDARNQTENKMEYESNVLPYEMQNFIDQYQESWENNL